MQLVEARRHGQAKDSGVDLGWRRECFWRQGEELLDAGVQLRGYREQAVVARAGWCGDAVGNLTLDHHDGAVDDWMRGEEVKQDIGCDVVRQIADDEETGRPLGVCGRLWLQVRFLGQRGEIGGEDVLAEDGYAGLRGEISHKLRSERLVELDGNEMAGAAREDVCNGAEAGSDFNDGAPRNVAEGVGDGSLRRGADEKVLAEGGAFWFSHRLVPALGLGGIGSSIPSFANLFIVTADRVEVEGRFASG